MIDKDNPEYDEAYGRHTGICRACKKMSFNISNDDGYCGDCN